MVLAGVLFVCGAVPGTHWGYTPAWMAGFSAPRQNSSPRFAVAGTILGDHSDDLGKRRSEAPETGVGVEMVPEPGNYLGGAQTIDHVRYRQAQTEHRPSRLRRRKKTSVTDC